ncbi:uncharacterized protein G2W53_012064 [Senna tora]|uniref:Uncharacterized protein n=1 Tax=Senna tora TaxID=362788 RepID=A0A834WRP3_9FABA|nr:uncharacterized protein G2W53_012064 [Senna tora]
MIDCLPDDIEKKKKSVTSRKQSPDIPEKEIRGRADRDWERLTPAGESTVSREAAGVEAQQRKTSVRK